VILIKKSKTDKTRKEIPRIRVRSNYTLALARKKEEDLARKRIVIKLQMDLLKDLIPFWKFAKCIIE
jgi:hypothetical protein